MREWLIPYCMERKPLMIVDTPKWINQQGCQYSRIID